jgi:aspartate 1-decarboxylase
MQRMMCKGKIHRATVTEANLDYVGSITIDAELIRAANLLPYEMVQVTSLRNATRWKTYVLPAEEGSGEICLNGPPAHLFQPGDLVIILSLGLYNEQELQLLKPSIVFVNGKNKITKIEKIDLSGKVNPHE